MGDVTLPQCGVEACDKFYLDIIKLAEEKLLATMIDSLFLFVLHLGKISLCNLIKTAGLRTSILYLVVTKTSVCFCLSDLRDSSYSGLFSNTWKVSSDKRRKKILEWFTFKTTITDNREWNHILRFHLIRRIFSKFLYTFFRWLRYVLLYILLYQVCLAFKCNCKKKRSRKETRSSS